MVTASGSGNADAGVSTAAEAGAGFADASGAGAKTKGAPGEAGDAGEAEEEAADADANEKGGVTVGVEGKIGALNANGCVGGVAGAEPKTKGAGVEARGGGDENTEAGENEGAFGDLMGWTMGFAAPPTRPPLRSPDMKAPGGRYKDRAGPTRERAIGCAALSALSASTDTLGACGHLRKRKDK